MKITQLSIEGAFLIEPDRTVDERGFFARIWDADEMHRLGLRSEVVQRSISWSEKAGTLRGLHYQTAPHQEAKVVRCTLGAIWDVIVDVRQGSRTYRRWAATDLSAQNRRLIYVPEGCAHGFQTLVDSSEVEYQMSTPYRSECARGVRWDDPSLGIPWPHAATRIISSRDQSFDALEKV